MILNRQFYLRKLINGQQSYEKMINIHNKQENASQNLNEISAKSCQNGYYQNNEKTRIGKYMEKREPWCTFSKNVDTTTMENSMAISQNIKNILIKYFKIPIIFD